MELDKLHVLVRQTSTADHSGSVTGTGVSTGSREVGLAGTAAGQYGVLSVEPVDGSVLQAEGDDTNTFSVFHQQIQGKVLNKVIAVVSEIVGLIKSLLHSFYQIFNSKVKPSSVISYYHIKD